VVDAHPNSTRNLRPAPIRDLSGGRVGQLTVLTASGKDNHGRVVWACVCDCGARKNIASRHLVQGRVQSCGCYGRSISGKNGKVGAPKISGAKSHLYKPALSHEDRHVRRNLVELREWRTAVFRRDAFKCGLCGAGGSVQAHHLDCWADYPERRFDLSNGITLCRPCHKAFHASMGGERKPCSALDYIAFQARWYLDREIARLERAQLPVSAQGDGGQLPPVTTAPLDVSSLDCAGTVCAVPAAFSGVGP
jgi:hypothetical protein